MSTLPSSHLHVMNHVWCLPYVLKGLHITCYIPLVVEKMFPKSVTIDLFNAFTVAPRIIETNVDRKLPVFTYVYIMYVCMYVKYCDTIRFVCTAESMWWFMRS